MAQMFLGLNWCGKLSGGPEVSRSPFLDLAFPVSHPHALSTHPA